MSYYQSVCWEMPLVNENGNRTNPVPILTWYKAFKQVLVHLLYDQLRPVLLCCEAASDIQRQQRATHINRRINNTTFKPVAIDVLGTPRLFYSQTSVHKRLGS